MIPSMDRYVNRRAWRLGRDSRHVLGLPALPDGLQAEIDAAKATAVDGQQARLATERRRLAVAARGAWCRVCRRLLAPGELAAHRCGMDGDRRE